MRIPAGPHILGSDLELRECKHLMVLGRDQEIPLQCSNKGRAREERARNRLCFQLFPVESLALHHFPSTQHPWNIKVEMSDLFLPLMAEHGSSVGLNTGFPRAGFSWEDLCFAGSILQG